MTGIPTDEEQATGMEKIVMHALREGTVSSYRKEFEGMLSNIYVRPVATEFPNILQRSINLNVFRAAVRERDYKI